MEILAFRMRTGEDVIAKIASHDEETGEYTINDPAVPVTERNEVGQERLHLIKWSPYAADPTFTLARTDYVSQPYRVAKEIEDIYLQATSGIQLPGALNG